MSAHGGERTTGLGGVKVSFVLHPVLLNMEATVALRVGTAVHSRDLVCVCSWYFLPGGTTRPCLQYHMWYDAHRHRPANTNPGDRPAFLHRPL